MEQPALRVISLGWGVQSWTLAAMSALGELPKVDFVIHSDTGWERQSTYEFARHWTPWLEDHDIRVETVSPSDGWGTAEGPGVFIPAYTIDKQSGVNGQVRRQCTGRWKIQPMRQYISAELKAMGLSKREGAVEQWLGISMDEWTRMKDSDVKYVKHRFPLIERRMTRQDCLLWLEAHGLPSPGKSACTFCPYHSKAAWQSMKQEGGVDWKQAVQIDNDIRHKRGRYPVFVHAARVPLEQAVSVPGDFGATQLELLASDDADAQCDSGYCFL